MKRMKEEAYINIIGQVMVMLFFVSCIAFVILLALSFVLRIIFFSVIVIAILGIIGWAFYSAIVDKLDEKKKIKEEEKIFNK